MSTRSDATGTPGSHAEFRFDISPRYRALAALFRIGPGSAFVQVTDAEFLARFGPWQVRTPLANIASVSPTGPYRFVKTAGPARLTLGDRGLTFATNGERGVLLEFLEPIKGLDPFGLLSHPNLTVTVAEPAALIDALRRVPRPDGA